MSVPEVRVCAYEVSCLPDTSPSRRAYALTITHTGDYLWTVSHLGQTLSPIGTWEPGGPAGRWTYEEALRRAKEAAPRIVLNGMNPAQVLEWEASR